MPDTLLIDCAWTKPTPAAVKAAGYRGVIGYISHDSGKDLGAKQAKAYIKAGLVVGLVFETTATEAEHNAATGAADARYAEQRAKAMGYPADCPIFYAVDEDVPGVKVTNYFRGIHQARRHPAGPYGSFTVVEFLAKHGLADVSWQTGAWSGDNISDQASLYQRTAHTGPKIKGVAHNSYDEDVVLKPVALWGGTVGPVAAPKPPVVKPPAKATRLTPVTRFALTYATRRLNNRRRAVDRADRPLLTHVQLAAQSALGIKEKP